MTGQSADSDWADVLTMGDIVTLGNAVMTIEGHAVGFDHNVAERIVRKHVSRALREAADECEAACTHQSGPCFCGSAPWLRDRADQVNWPGTPGGESNG